MDEAAQTAALARLELSELWGIGTRIATRLEALGIHSPLALRNADPKFIRAQFSVVMERMVWELRGVPCLDLEQAIPNRQTIMASRSFGRPVEELHEMQEAVASYVSRAAEKMRRQNLVTPALQIFILTNRFKSDDPQYNGYHTVHLPVATADTTRLVRAALHGLACVWREGFQYKKAGVICLDLQAAGKVQETLFHASDSPQRIKLMQALDTLNKRYGRDTVTVATAGTHKAWGLRCNQRSPAYTTRWRELLSVV